jgi:hypothetical protein
MCIQEPAPRRFTAVCNRIDEEAIIALCGAAPSGPLGPLPVGSQTAVLRDTTTANEPWSDST